MVSKAILCLLRVEIANQWLQWIINYDAVKLKIYIRMQSNFVPTQCLLLAQSHMVCEIIITIQRVILNFPNFPNGLMTRENLFWTADCFSSLSFTNKHLVHKVVFVHKQAPCLLLAPRHSCTHGNHEWKILYRRHSSCVNTCKSILREIFSQML